MRGHPGPPAPDRVQRIACRAHPLRLRLRAGMALERAAALAFAEAGLQAGWMRLGPMALRDLAWVIPAHAGPGNPRIAWYSETRQAPGGAILAGGLHLGTKAGGPFCHAHGLWRDAAGGLHMGHLRGDQTVLAGDAVAGGLGLTGARLTVEDDAETGFALFAPCAFGRDAVPAEGTENGGTGAALIRLRPGQDLTGALRALDLPPGARIEGLGSLAGAVFDDAPPIPGPAAEIWLRGTAPGPGGLRLHVAATGTDGAVREGWLRPGANPVCVTAELLVSGL